VVTEEGVVEPIAAVEGVLLSMREREREIETAKSKNSEK